MNNMSNEANKVYEFLNTKGYIYDIVEHEASFRVSDHIDIKVPENSVGVKNLFLRDDKKTSFYLVVVPQAKKVNIKELRRQIKSKPLSFADEQQLWYYLKVLPGSVSPFGIINDQAASVHVILDQELFNYEKIGAHPNDNTKTIWISPNDIQSMIKDNGNYLTILLVPEKY